MIGCSAPVAIPASTFPPQGLSLQPLQTHSPAGCPRSIATATSRARPCRRKTASSCAPSDAASRRSSRSSGRRTRSSAWKPNCDAPGAPAHESFTRSGAAFSSESRPRQTSSGTRSPHEARGVLPHWAMTQGRRVKGAPGDGVGAEALETPAPWGVSRRLVPRRRRTRLLDRGVSGGLGSNVFRVILLGSASTAPWAATRKAGCESAPIAANTCSICKARVPAKDPPVRHRRLPTKRPGRWRRKPETFCIGLETAGPDCAARASPTD